MHKSSALMLAMLAGSLAFAQAGIGKDAAVIAPDKTAKRGDAAKTGAGHHKVGRKASKGALNPQPLPPGSKVELSPQPLPPGAAARANTSTADKVGFNPQPDPPGSQAKAYSKKGTPSAGKTAGNPQPLPPTAITVRKAGGNPQENELNPQPLPPGAKKPTATESPK